MPEPQRSNPLIDLIEFAETEEYRYEAALSAAVFYANRFGEAHPGVMEIKQVAVLTLFKIVPDSLAHAQKQWTKERAALGFWKRLRTPHEVPEEYVDEWLENERMRALMDVSHIISERGNEL